MIEVKPLNPPKGHAYPCRYYASDLKASFAANGEPLTVTFTSDKMNIYPGGSEQCVHSLGRFSATFSISSGGSPVSAVFN